MGECNYQESDEKENINAVPWKGSMTQKHLNLTLKNYNLEPVENKPKDNEGDFQIPSLLPCPPEEEEEEQKDHLDTESTIKVEDINPVEKENRITDCVQKQLKFDNQSVHEERIIQIQRYLFGTDLWFTGLGMSINELCNPKDQIIKQGELYRYKPGLDRVYISRWCQLTTKVLRVYKNQMSAKGFPNKPIVAIPLYVVQSVKRSRFKAPSSSKANKDTRVLSQNQFEFFYKDDILNEIMLEFLESKGMLGNEEDDGGVSERKCDDDVKEKLEILKSNLCSNQPFKIDSKTPTLNNSSSWSNREGEWFLAEKRLLFSTKRAQDLNDWLQCLKQIFSAKGYN